MSTFFSQNCPKCGRPHRVNVVYLGAQVSCGHCYARFVAECSDQVQIPAASHTNGDADSSGAKSRTAR